MNNTTKTGLVLCRYEGETWLGAAMRLANNSKGRNCDGEVRSGYDYYIKQGFAEEKAAWTVCYDMSILESISL